MDIQKSSIRSFDENIVVKRVLGAVQGKNNAPTIIFFGGIHGNEVAGVIALQKVIAEIQKNKIQLEGNFYAISGNIAALKINQRFVDVDLNRIWTKEQLEATTKKKHSEFAERDHIYYTIKEIVSIHNGPFYFIDLHTTSSETKPFITISDSLNNRRFSKIFSIPTVLGIEEYLDGPLLTFINEFGHIALGFEAGEHYKEASVDNCIAFIWLAMEASGCIKKSEIKKYRFYQHYVSLLFSKQEFYEIDYKHHIQPSEHFKMLNGFTNFEPIHKEQNLADSNGKVVSAPINGNIFMPLYQEQGDDGFFIITKISKFWLNFSSIVRKLKLHHLLRVLPGISKDKTNSHTLIVNPRTARFLATEIFHLFGYRKIVMKDAKYHFIKRDRKVTELV